MIIWLGSVLGSGECVENYCNSARSGRGCTKSGREEGLQGGRNSNNIKETERDVRKIPKSKMNLQVKI